MEEATYAKGISLREAGQYDEALAVFKGVRNRAGLSDAVNETNYRKARSLFDAGNYAAAMQLFSRIPSHKDARDYLAQAQERQQPKDYSAALALMKAGRYEYALPVLQKMPAYRDSAALAKECNYQLALSLHPAKPVITADPGWNIDGDAFRTQYKAYDLFRQLRGYKDVDAILRDAYFVHELADAKWATEDGAFSLEIGHPTYSSAATYGGEAIYINWHGRERMRTQQLLTNITTVKGNQLSDGSGPDAYSMTGASITVSGPWVIEAPVQR